MFCAFYDRGYCNMSSDPTAADCERAKIETKKILENEAKK
jgi:hypothetical protein